MEPVHEILQQRRGLATFGEIVAASSKTALAKALERGEVIRLARGVYGLPGTDADKAAAIAYDGVVSHQSAAAAWSLPLLEVPDKPHITLPRKRRPHPGPPAVLHWGPITPVDRRIRVTSLVRTVLDCARVLPFGEALAVADAALATGLLRQRELAAAAASVMGPGSPTVRLVGQEASGAADSLLESMLRALLVIEGIDGFEPQVLVTRGRFRARVDLGHREARIALEADGYEHHGSRRDFAADCRRYDELVAAGWIVLRFSYEQVIWDGAWVIAMVRQVLADRRRTDR